jgi:glycerol-3-phosphate dehydrogenase
VQRKLSNLANQTFDLVIVGGGIFGVCAAWDAVLRGLSVALLERGDFANATSANSYKIAHGGVRYVQHLDLVRVHSSCAERSALLRIAPHLVYPLPILVPTYGYGRRGKGLLGLGLGFYDLLTAGRNRGIQDHGRRIPRARFTSRDEALSLFPALAAKGLTGGALFYDGQIYNPPRLALSFLQSAVEAGATVANYVDVTRFLESTNHVVGVEACDVLTGEQFQIRGKCVLNASGPWAESLLRRTMSVQVNPKGTYSRDACFVVRKQLNDRIALAVQGRTKDPDAIFSRSARHLFVVPWRQYSLVGVWHRVYSGNPEYLIIGEVELDEFIEEINNAYPGLGLSSSDVLMWNTGLVPFGANEPGQKDLSYGKRSRLVDHWKTNGIQGLVTLIGVRYTMARGDAARAIDLICKKLDCNSKRPRTDNIALHGGDIDDFEGLTKQVQEEHPTIAVDVARALAHNHGSTYKRILKSAEEEPSLVLPIGDSTVLGAEIINAVREEMAMSLADVVLRRTDLATGENPGENALSACADIMAKELGWSKDRKMKELRDLDAFLRMRKPGDSTKHVQVTEKNP